MFGKKKSTEVKISGKVVRVMHYEGIDAFAQDYPCTMTISDGNIIIKMSSPEITVKLPLNRVTSFSSLSETEYMQKYHGNGVSTSKMRNVAKHFLAITYDKGMIGLWGDNAAWDYFNKLMYGDLLSGSVPKEIEL